jgi:hypothetical protein
MTRSSATLILLAAVFVGSACASTSATRARRAPVDASPAIALLQATNFDAAGAKANEILSADPQNSQAHVVAAIVIYKQTVHQVVRDVLTLIEGASHMGINHGYAQYAMDSALAGLKTASDHLEAAAADPAFSLDLCLACWKYDWNHNGRIDRGDQELFQIELDSNGEPIPEGDPRRTPTFHFDIGDVHWARAMVSFQRAALSILRAWDFHDLDRLMRLGSMDTLTIRLVDRGRLLAAKQLILAGLQQAELSRTSYLAETDDNNEWVPNPRQKNHPLPLPVDDKLYETWAGVLADLTKLVQGQEGLSVAQLAQLGDHTWTNAPGGYLNLGRLLEQPGDLVFHMKSLDGLDRGREHPAALEALLREMFGDKYVQSMPPSKLIARLARMKIEIDRGHESAERKLRYLFWLN